MLACKRNIDVLFLQWNFWWPGGFSSVADFYFLTINFLFYFILFFFNVELSISFFSNII